MTAPDRTAVEAAVKQLDAALRTVFGLRAPVLTLGPQSVDALRTVLDTLEQLSPAHDAAVKAWDAQQEIIQAERRRAEKAEAELERLSELADDNAAVALAERNEELRDEVERQKAELERLGRVEQEQDEAKQRPACPECGRTDVPLTSAGQLEYHFDNRPDDSGQPSQLRRCKGIGAPAATADLAARDEREAGR